MDRGEVVGAVFLDLNKAFEMVSHHLLLSKMSLFNISPEAVGWLASFLQGREQCVKVARDKSSLLNIRMGIPQCSILELMLINLFINDLPLICPGFRCQLYADDTIFYASAKTPDQAAEVLSACMAEVSHWLTQNKLVLNFTKTVAMCFSIKKHNLEQTFQIHLQNDKIQSVTQFKYVGLVLDPQLKCDKHIEKISKTI